MKPGNLHFARCQILRILYLRDEVCAHEHAGICVFYFFIGKDNLKENYYGKTSFYI